MFARLHRINRLNLHLLETKQVQRINQLKLIHNRKLPTIHEYKWFLPIQTRWKDNDQYGHINNAVYHSYFDTTINVYLLRYCNLMTSLSESKSVGFMVEVGCSFHLPINYPNVYLSGMSISKIGRSSVRYELALFPLKNDESNYEANIVHGHFYSDKIIDYFSSAPAATGHYVHVFVDPSEDNKPCELSSELRNGLEKLKTF